MGIDNVNLAALIGSRICHDLISPVGAINNGLELLEMSGDLAGPELELISDSVGNANARIRFFRVAFGSAGNQQLSRAETVAILEDMSKGARLQFQWSPLEACNRQEVRLSFLALQCLETAMPYGGTAKVFYADGKWTVIGEAPKINVDDDLWARISGGQSSSTITPALVQFAMLPEMAKSMDRTVRVEQSLDKITINF
ncbi:histidine phosphotransferase [Parasedimentitalea marina]|uniref:Histidine phosphotransferase n=1 Tax=Parasedimentitalea marina TaxID=2483033 RepID=A0A3T0N2L2_9RHOB|nr:histidine phosphotransferase family protein [Parasedimentitalea marina]AZV78263.1 histidine phosphotransferase [Parasedimentitalea marina]